MKFRKKAIVVEAEQWVEGKRVDGVIYEDEWREGKSHRIRTYVQTREGPLNVSSGDWIVTGVTGEKYPVKPDIFAQTYERVEE